MKILAFTTRNMRGVAGEAALEHFCILNEYSDSFDLLVTDKTEKSRDLLKEKMNLNVDKVFTSYTSEFIDNHLDYKDWFDVYEQLDVSQFQDYDMLYLCGGMFFPNSGISEKGRLNGKFPHKVPLKFMSTAQKVINVLVILKIHNEYGVPLHELAFDPDELNCYQYDESIATRIDDNYYVYHGYDFPKYNVKRLDSVQCGIDVNPNKRDLNKVYELTFGYTFKNKDRNLYIEEFTNFSKEIYNKNVFIREIGNKDVKPTFKKRDEYLDYIAKSRYTYMMPSYWDEFISVFRLIESINLDCLPILSDHCNVQPFNESFGVDLNVLKVSNIEEKGLPSEEKRLLLLKELQDKIINTERKLFDEIEVPDFIERELSDLDDW